MTKASSMRQIRLIPIKLSLEADDKSDHILLPSSHGCLAVGGPRSRRAAGELGNWQRRTKSYNGHGP